MASGIKVADECLAAFTDLKAKKNRFVCLHIGKDSGVDVVQVKHVAGRDATFSDFLEQVHEKEPMYALYDIEFDHEDGGRRARIAMITWIPNTAPVRAKMVYASTKEAVSSAIDFSPVVIQATDNEEISERTVFAKVKASFTS